MKRRKAGPTSPGGPGPQQSQHSRPGNSRAAACLWGRQAPCRLGDHTTSVTQRTVTGHPRKSLS